VRALAIETATTGCAVGLMDGDQLVERVLDTERRHTEVLSGGIADLLADHGLKVGDLDVVVVDRGPGLFTGLRVGIATAQSLAYALGLGLTSVTSLETLAQEAFDDGVRGTYEAVVDARRGEVFVQTFALNAGIEPVDQPQVTTPSAVTDELRASGEAVTLGGDGVVRYAALFSNTPTLTLRTQTIPSPSSALRRGAYRRNESSISPLYLRDADAVANFTTRDVAR